MNVEIILSIGTCQIVSFKFVLQKKIIVFLRHFFINESKKYFLRKHLRCIQLFSMPKSIKEHACSSAFSFSNSRRMIPLAQFLNIWNYSKIFPKIHYNEISKQYNYDITKRRIFIYVLVLVSKICTIYFANRNEEHIKHHLIRFYGSTTVINTYVQLFTVYWFKEEICKLLNTIQKMNKVAVVNITRKKIISVKHFVCQNILILIYLIFMILSIFEIGIIGHLQPLLVIYPCKLFQCFFNFFLMYFLEYIYVHMETLSDMLHGDKGEENFEKKKEMFTKLIEFRGNVYEVFLWPIVLNLFQISYKLLGFFYYNLFLREDFKIFMKIFGLINMISTVILLLCNLNLVDGIEGNVS